MKKIMLSILTLFGLTFNVHADTWQDHWQKAIECCGDKNYEEAESEFNLAIQFLELSQNNMHPHVYVDRARLYLLQDRYAESLADLNKAIASEYLTTNDKIRGLVTRIFTCSNLHMDDQVFSDYNEFKAIDPNFPKVEFSKEKVIIRNIPKSKCYKKLVKAFLVGSRICEKESDIVEHESGIMIAKRKVCNCASNKIKAVAFDFKTPSPGQQEVDNCKYWCDKVALAGIAWCAKAFKRWDCQTGCIFAVDLIKDGCHWCCKEGNFYEKCIQPFEDILSYMRQPCDPEWD